jgi:hypothetical protein
MRWLMFHPTHALQCPKAHFHIFFQNKNEKPLLFFQGEISSFTLEQILCFGVSLATRIINRFNTQ